MFCCFNPKHSKYQERLIIQPNPVITLRYPEWNVYKPFSPQSYEKLNEKK